MILPDKVDCIYNEFWIPLTNEVVRNVEDIYLISNYGRLYNIETKHYLPQDMNYSKDKYITIRLRLKDKSHICKQVHRLVLESFIPTPNSDLLEVNHKDGIKYHNWIWNLEWINHLENMQHASNNQLFHYCEEHQNSKLSNDEVHKICQLIVAGKSPVEIADIINRPDCNIRKIVTNIKGGHSWLNISRMYGIIDD